VKVKDRREMKIYGVPDWRGHGEMTMSGKFPKLLALSMGLCVLSCSGTQAAKKGGGAETGGPVKEVVKNVETGKGVEPGQPVPIARRIQLNEGFQVTPGAQLAGNGETMAAAWVEFSDFPANLMQLMASVLDDDGNFIASRRKISSATYGFNFLRLRWTGKGYVLLWTDDARAVESCKKKMKDEALCGIEHGWAWKSMYTATLDGSGNAAAKAAVIVPEAKVHEVEAAFWRGSKVAILWTDIREDGECRKKDVFEGEADPARWCFGGLHFTLLETADGSSSGDALVSGKKTVLLEEPRMVFTGKRYVVVWQDGKNDKSLQCKHAVKQGSFPSGDCRGELFLTLLDDQGAVVQKAAQVTQVPPEKTLSAFEAAPDGQNVAIAWQEGEQEPWKSKILGEDGSLGDGPALSPEDLDKLLDSATSGEKDGRKIKTTSFEAVLDYVDRREEHMFENVHDLFIDITYLKGAE
jgi:hypothetical protein